ncbi:MAG: acyl-CoA dehydrogenase [Rubrivivax sp.]|nr:acyl-CoA dehydrogenase [Rubrivivax sp.]
MNLSLTPEQQMLQEAATRLFSAEATPQRVRAAEAQGGFDAALWQQLVELGFATMRMPEADAPAGMGLLEAVLVAELAGAHLAPVPLAEALTGARLLAQLPGAGAEAWAAKVRDGALAVLAPLPLDAERPVVIPGGAAAAAALLLDGDTVLLVERAHLDARASLGSAAMAVTRLAPGSGPASPRPEGAQVLAQGPEARDAFLAAVEEWKLLTAAQLAGLAGRALAMAAAYASERRQFDKAIGSFQGIAHPLADSLTEVEGAQLLVWRAVWALAHRPTEAAAAISAAWIWTAQAAPRATARALHTFGGYGVSLEYDIQLYYRRARAWSLVRGDLRDELQRLADRLWSDARVALPAPGDVQLQFGVGAAAEAFGAEVRAFFEKSLTPELRAHAHHSVKGYHAGFNRQLAEAGLLFPHWPTEFGGRGKSPFDMAALGEVFEDYGWQRITAPVTNQVAQIVMRFATEEVKQEALPRFASGEALGCLGFSEPSSGCDVFAARMRAVRDGAEHWRIDGQKIFTTAGNLAQYIFLLVRTNPDVPKHKGLSLFLVPMDLPGISLQPVHTLQDERTNITFFDNVRVHDRYRIGAVDGGLDVMAATLELEHGGDQYRLSFRQMFRHALAWAQRTQRDGRPLIDHADIRARLAQVAVHTLVAEVLCHRTIWGVHEKVPGRAAWGPMSKVFSTEMYWRDANELMELAAPETLFEDTPDAGVVELGYRQSIGMTIYGGTSEVQRSLIAEQGLGLPRSRS